MRIAGGRAREWLRRGPMECLVASYYVSPRTDYRAWRASEFCTALYRWKLKPDPAFTEREATRVAAAVREHLPGGFDGVTCPAPGPHRIAAGWYPAGALAKAVGVLLDLDTVTCFERVGYGMGHMTGKGATGGASRAQERDALGSVNVSGLHLLLVDDALLSGQSLARLHALLTAAGGARPGDRSREFLDCGIRQSERLVGLAV